MKKRIFMTMMTILVSGCYSYQSIPNAATDHTKGERVKLVMSNQNKKGKLVQVTKDTVVLENGKKSNLKIARAEVLDMRRGKFSILKTLSIPAGVWLGGFVIFHLGGGPSFNLGDGF